MGSILPAVGFARLNKVNVEFFLFDLRQVKDIPALELTDPNPG
jgi:hypothetical protein